MSQTHSSTKDSQPQTTQQRTKKISWVVVGGYTGDIKISQVSAVSPEEAALAFENVWFDEIPIHVVAKGRFGENEWPIKGEEDDQAVE